MHTPIIELENISKLYHLGLIGATTFRESVERFFCKVQGKEDTCRTIGAKRSMIAPDDPQAGPEPNTIWALKDVSFSVNRGEIVGIIGRNGAGKSTLLKILSRITEPTQGRATIRGRVASLLEVGTGFHPELTGKENIYLNGAILGLRKQEITRKFDEIVAFAEIDKFIDTPVKRYSSGMYLRLAFAVAAHLEPEILLVDEVLAVGDMSFQKKCLGKMGEVAKAGRTVLFVSHSMEAIRKLCSRAFLLVNGRIVIDAQPQLTIDKYISCSESLCDIPLAERNDRQGTGDLYFTSIKFQTEHNADASTFISGQNCKIIIYFENRVKNDLKNVDVTVGIDSYMGERMASLSTGIINENFETIKPGVSSFELNIKKLPLVQGRYRISIVCAANHVVCDWIHNAGFLDIEAGDYYNSGKLPIPALGEGSFLMDYNFKLRA